MSSNAREIKDVFYLVALQGINYIAPLLVLPYLMMVLGAEKFGYISFALIVTQYLMLLVDFGFNFTATKRIALAKGNQAELNRIFTSTLYAKIGLLLASFLVLLAIAQVPQFEIYRQAMFVMFLVVVGNAFTFIWLFQGLGQIRFIAIFNAIAKLSILPLTFVFVKNPDDYLTAAFLQASVSIFAMLISIAYVIKKKWVKITSFVGKNVISDLKDSYPIFLSGAATSIYTASFGLMLGYFALAEAVGQYSAAERIMRGFCWLIFIPVSQAFFPKISALSQSDPNRAKKMIKKLAIFVGIAMLAVFFILFFLSDYLMLFLRDDFEGIDLLFKIMAIVPFFVALGGVFGQLGLLALGDERDKMNFQRVYLIAGVFALVSIFVSIPLWGTIGAAVSLLMTEIIVCGLMIWFGRKILKKSTQMTQI